MTSAGAMVLEFKAGAPTNPRPRCTASCSRQLYELKPGSLNPEGWTWMTIKNAFPQIQAAEILLRCLNPLLASVLAVQPFT